jgi:hypothetical protein
MVGGHAEDWGFIPSFLDEDDERTAQEQINAHYIGGWNAFEGFTLNPETMQLSYTGDPPMLPISVLVFRDETLYMYDHAWTLIMQKSGDWTIARLD